MTNPKSLNNEFKSQPNESGQPDPKAANDISLRFMRKWLFYCVLLCTGCLAIPFVTYYFADALGGHYYIGGVGIILVSVFLVLLILYVMLKTLYLQERYFAFCRTAALAVCGITAYAYLFTVALQFVSKEVPVIETEQSYLCEELGMRCTIPGGYTEFQTQSSAETEANYAYYRCAANNEMLGLRIEGVINIIPNGVGLNDLTEYCTVRDSTFYTGGFVNRTHVVQFCGREMMYSEGQTTQFPNLIYSNFDIIHGSSLITVSFHFAREDYVKTELRHNIEEVMSNIELF